MLTKQYISAFWVEAMPRLIATKEEFEKLLTDATEVRVVKLKEAAKVKLRTKDVLYTYKTTPDEADSLTKGLKIPIIDY